MEFLKNIEKDFVLNNHKLLEQEIRGYKGLFEDQKVYVKISEIHMEYGGMSMYISKVSNIDKLVDKIINAAIAELDKDVNKLNRLGKKVIKAWEANPDSFKKKAGVYVNSKVLTSREYSHSVFVSFLKYSSFPKGEYGFTTGQGSFTYESKKTLEKMLVDIDKFAESEKKKLNSKKIKDRIKKYITKADVELSFKQAVKYLEIPDTSIIDKVKSIIPKSKPAFPVPHINENFLNWILSETGGDEIEINQELIEEVREEYDFDLSMFEEWTLEGSTDGYHNTDGDYCDYTVTFSSPEGHEYFAYNTHCLVTGWNFNEKVEFN